MKGGEYFDWGLKTTTDGDAKSDSSFQTALTQKWALPSVPLKSSPSSDEISPWKLPEHQLLSQEPNAQGSLKKTGVHGFSP